MLKNNGTRAAEEVAQVYVSRPDSKVGRPAHELKGYSRVALNPGESRKVQISIPVERLRHYSEELPGWTVEPGAVSVYVGPNVLDLPLSQSGIKI